MSEFLEVSSSKPAVMHVQVAEKVIRAPHEYVQAGELTSDSSLEDRIAYEVVKSSTKLVEDHFQLPLLWRDKKEALTSNQHKTQKTVDVLETQVAQG